MSYKILVIEDNEEMADNIASILELARYQVTIAPNGKLGVEQALNNRPDLILCDIMMPELDGYGVMYILNNNQDTANIPFVFLTAKADNSDFRMGMNLGADDYITKPFDGVELLKVLDMRLKKSEMLKASYAHSGSSESSPADKRSEQECFQKLLENRPVRHFKKKDFLFMEGYSPNDLFCIEQGRVKTYKINADGKELITGIHKTGDFLGYVPLLEDKPYYENAEALEDVRVSIIPKAEFLHLIYSSKEMASKFIKMLSNNLEEMENRLMDLAYQSVRKRVAGALLKINDMFIKADSKATINFSRKDISNMVGTATESLNRTLADFKEEGLVEITGEGLRIINKPKLERLMRLG